MGDRPHLRPGRHGVGVAPDGRVVRFDGMGDISGDWGGERRSGWRRRQRQSGRATAVAPGRASRSSRCPPTSACRRRGPLVRALYSERVAAEGRLGELSHVVFAAAITMVTRLPGRSWSRLADQLRRHGDGPDSAAAPGSSGPRRRARRRSVPCRGSRLQRRLAEAIADAAPAARVLRLEAPPVLGSALLGLERSPVDRSSRMWRIAWRAIWRRSATVPPTTDAPHIVQIRAQDGTRWPSRSLIPAWRASRSSGSMSC